MSDDELDDFISNLNSKDGSNKPAPVELTVEK